MQVWRETTGGQTWEAGPSDTSLSLSQSPERPAALGRDPGMSLLHPNSLFSRLGTPKGTTFCPLVKWERESRGWEGGYGELPTRSAFSHPHEVNFFNIGRRAGRRGPGDRGPARGPGWRAGSGRDLAWAATMAPAREIAPWGDRVVAAASRTLWVEERAGRSTLLRPVEDSELGKAPARIGWLSRDRGKPGPAN